MPIFLILIGTLLIVLNVRAIKKEKDSFKNILNQKELDTTEVEVMIGSLRREFAETLLELQKEIVELKKEKPIVQIEEDDYENEKVEDENYEDEQVSASEELSVLLQDEETENDKVNKVKELFKEGKSVEEVCEKLNIGKGEVLLIKELYRD